MPLGFWLLSLEPENGLLARLALAPKGRFANRDKEAKQRVFWLLSLEPQNGRFANRDKEAKQRAGNLPATFSQRAGNLPATCFGSVPDKHNPSSKFGLGACISFRITTDIFI